MKTRNGDEPHWWLDTLLKAALVCVGVAGIAGWLVLAFVHLDDRYRIGHVQGHWMALAQYSNAGTLYPPLYDGARFGGTRHMPLPILVNAAAARLTGEYVISGKTVAMGLFGFLLILVVVTLRQLCCPWPIAIGLIGLLPATNTGVLVGSTPGGDVLPVVLQVCALMLAAAALRRQTVGVLLAAAVLAGLAAMSKLTGGWAALAVLGWLGLRRDWRRIGWFLSAWSATIGATFGTVQWFSDGRFLTTFLSLTFAGGGGPIGWIRAPSQLVFFGIGDAPAIWMIVPFAAVGWLATWRASTLTIYHHALAWSLVLTILVFTDIGAGLNQLLDPAVLTVVVVGVLAANSAQERLGTITLSTALTLTVIWAGITGLRGFVPDLREAVTSVRAGDTLPQYNPRLLTEIALPGQKLLAEDPGIPVLLSQTPIVLDAFMLRRLDQIQPQAVESLIASITRREFDRVALIIPLEGDDYWWRYYHFGLRVVEALRQHYVFIGRFGGYYVYQPKRP